jgi:hypothetical protein
METFLSFMPYFCVAYGAFYIGKHWALFQFSQNLSKDPDRMIEILKQIKEINHEVDENSMPEDANPMEVERVGDVLYAYDKHSGQFLAQAPTLNNLLEVVHNRFPNKKFFGTISNDNPTKELVK